MNNPQTERPTEVSPLTRIFLNLIEMTRISEREWQLGGSPGGESPSRLRWNRTTRTMTAYCTGRKMGYPERGTFQKHLRLTGYAITPIKDEWWEDAPNKAMRHGFSWIVGDKLPPEPPKPPEPIQLGLL